MSETELSRIPDKRDILIDFHKRQNDSYKAVTDASNAITFYDVEIDQKRGPSMYVKSKAGQINQ